jgi:AcrR family transcriptional regulator
LDANVAGASGRCQIAKTSLFIEIVPRNYELKKRALTQAETRQRILEATIELHSTLGPARTTISAIAERAGVQRLTVYRHFADERSLFEGCRDLWMAENPAPDVSRWAALEDPAERMQVALGEIYAYFRSTEGMTGNVVRDFALSPALREAAVPFMQYWESVRRALDSGWTVRGQRRERLRAVIGHAVEFETWRSLARGGGLADGEIAELMVRLARVI